MATFTSDKAKTSAARRYSHRGLVIEFATYSGSATLSAGDVVQMVKVPAGARVENFTLSTNTLTTSSTGTLSIGDGLNTDRYMASAQPTYTGVTHGAAKNHAAHGYEYSADDTVDVRVATVGGDGTANPVIKLTLAYYCDNPS